MTVEPKRDVKLFYCYAREDTLLRDKLEVHLSSLKRQNLITTWHDRKISPGMEWEREIDVHLNTADIILLLVSPEFVASDYCYSIEMKRALERHKAREARIIPILLRPVDWEAAPFSTLQMLPSNGRPVTRWQDRDEAFLNIAKAIRIVVKELSASEVAEDSLTTLPQNIERSAAIEDSMISKGLIELPDVDSEYDSLYRPDRRRGPKKTFGGLLRIPCDVNYFPREQTLMYIWTSPYFLLRNLLLPSLLLLFILSIAFLWLKVNINLSSSILLVSVITSLLVFALAVYIGKVFIAYLDNIYIITNRRIIHAVRYFSAYRAEKEADYKNIRDIKVKQDNLIGSFFGIGDIIIEMPGDYPDLYVLNVDHPFYLQDKIYSIRKYREFEE